jgi:hypothetical protein
MTNHDTTRIESNLAKIASLNKKGKLDSDEIRLMKREIFIIRAKAAQADRYPQKFNSNRFIFDCF